MKSPRSSAAAAVAIIPAAPSVYEHSTQPQWGRAVLAATLTDRATYVFENAGERTFMNGYSSIVEVQLDPEERESLAKRLLRGHASATTATKKKSTKAKTTKAPKAKATKAKAEKAPEREPEAPESLSSDDE